MMHGGESLLTFFALVVLVELETLEGSATCYELVGELGFMVWVVIAPALVVDLVVSVFRFTCWSESESIGVGVYIVWDIPQPKTMIAKYLEERYVN